MQQQVPSIIYASTYVNDVTHLGGIFSRRDKKNLVTIADYRSMLLVLALMVWNGLEYSMKTEKQ